MKLKKSILFITVFCFSYLVITGRNTTPPNDSIVSHIYYDTVTFTISGTEWNDSLKLYTRYDNRTVTEIVEYDTTPRYYRVIYIKEANKIQHNTDSAYIITLYSLFEKEFFTVVSLKKDIDNSNCKRVIEEEKVYIFSLKKLNLLDRAPQIGVRAKVIVEGKEIRVPIRAYDYNTYTTSNLKGICYLEPISSE